jgi:hypothetical protein
MWGWVVIIGRKKTPSGLNEMNLPPVLHTYKSDYLIIKTFLTLNNYEQNEGLCPRCDKKKGKLEK